MTKEIKILLTLGDGIKITSVNAMYKARVVYKMGRPVATIYKSSEATRMVNNILDSLRAIDFNPHLEWLRECKQFTVVQNYVFKSGISRRDVGNAEKAISDAIVKFFKEELGLDKFDDSKFTDLHLYKQVLPGSEHEYIMVSIRPSTFNTRFDKPEKPSKITVGINPGEDWVKALTKDLAKNKIKVKNEDEADTEVHYITKDGFCSSQIAESLSSIYRHLGNGFCFVAFSREGWDESEMSSIEKSLEIMNLVAKDRGNIVCGWVNDDNELANWINEKYCSIK